VLAAYFGWLGSVALRITKRAWSGIVLGSAFVVVIFPMFQLLPTASLLQPVPAKMIVLFVEVAILMWGFIRFDFLTLLTSMITFLFCAGSYFALQLLQDVGTNQEMAVLVAWLVAVGAAAAIAFQSTLRTFSDRLRAALR
jgi:hypothetical protein